MSSQEPQKLLVKGRPISLAFSLDGKWLLACSDENRSNYFYYWQVDDTSVSGNGHLPSVSACSMRIIYTILTTVSEIVDTLGLSRRYHSL